MPALRTPSTAPAAKKPRPAMPQPRSCATCGDVFRTARMLHVHERVLHDRRPCHHCPHCGSLFGRAADLNAHILAEHDRAAMPVKCPDCVCAFHTGFQLRQHVATAHRRKLLRCAHCDFESCYWGVLKKHAESAHGAVLERNDGENDENAGYEEMQKKVVGYVVVSEKE